MIEVKVNTSQLAALSSQFKRWQVIAAAGFGGMMPAVGQLIVRQHRQRFSSGGADAGGWKTPIRGNSPLIMSGTLMGSIKARSGRFFTIVSPNKGLPYAYIHQGGGVITPRKARRLHYVVNGTHVYSKRSVIPPREYMGLSPANKVEIGLFVDRWVGRYF